MKIIITEEQMMSLRLKRRAAEINKISDIIEFQTEIQDPCDFEDAEDYIDFCIGQGLNFYYNDEELEDGVTPSVEMVDVREEVEEYLQEKFYDYLSDIYNDLIEKC
jgi:hypothetical protein